MQSVENIRPQRINTKKKYLQLIFLRSNLLNNLVYTAAKLRPPPRTETSLQ